MKFLICLALFIAAAQAGILAPVTTYSAVAPAYTTYAAAGPAYTSYAGPAFTTYAAAPAASAYTAYSAAVPASSYHSTVYSSAPVAYTAPVATYSTLLKK